MIKRDWKQKVLPGQQIIYVPEHVIEELDDIADAHHHPDVEFGFVEEIFSDSHARCRFVWKAHSNVTKHPQHELRTKSTSELTPLANIWKANWTEHGEVLYFWEKYIENKLPPTLLYFNRDLESIKVDYNMLTIITTAIMDTEECICEDDNEECLLCLTQRFVRNYFPRRDDEEST